MASLCHLVTLIHVYLAVRLMLLPDVCLHTSTAGAEKQCHVCFLDAHTSPYLFRIMCEQKHYAVSTLLLQEGTWRQSLA